MDELREEWLAEVELLLRQRIGLNPHAFSTNHIRDAVRQRQTACAGEDIANYLRRVRSQEDEFQELVERLIVPESWFFRDIQPFRCLEHYVSSRWQSGQSLRFLCVPCGTGEEPYSMAITLLQAGMAPAQFTVDAADISRRGLQLAAEGVYGKLSFREGDETVGDFRDRFFRRIDQRFLVKDEVRAGVHFRHANVVAADFLQGEKPYHVIFCRNLLIYLDPAARHLTLANLHRLVGEDGLLYVGHVEAASVPRQLFKPYGKGFPFAFQPCTPAMRGQGTGVGGQRVAGALRVPSNDSPPPRANSVDGTRSVPAAPTVAEPQAVLDRARQDADRGRLAEAESQCLELLNRHPPRAEVYCLLGVIRQAQGDMEEADKCFHKALYLHPRHHETLVHAALLASQRGQEQLAQNYQRRAERTRAVGPDSEVSS